MRKTIGKYWILLSSCVWVACQPSRFEPKQPEESYSTTHVQTPRLISTVSAPVEIPLAEIEKQINAQVNDVLYEDNSLEDNGNDNLMLKVWKRENIRLEADNAGFLITVPLKVWAKKGVNVLGMVSYQETTFALNARFVSAFSVNPDWQAVTTTTARGYEWIEKPYVRLGIIEVPITGIVGRILDQEQPKIASQMDAHLKNQLNFKPIIQHLWQTLHQPVQVSQQYNVWLRVTPLEIWMTPLVANGQAATARIGIKAHTETLIGQKPAPVVTSTVLALQTNAQATDDFQLGLTGEISHAAATQMAAAELVGKTFSFQNGSRKVTITSVDLYGNKNNLVIKTGITGSLEGTLYLVGKPYFNPQSQAIELSQLDFALDTKDRLVKAANWLAHGTLVKRMQENLKLPLATQLETARKNIQAQLVNRQLMKGVALNGTLDEFTPGEVIITPQSIVAVVTAKGKLGLKINGL